MAKKSFTLIELIIVIAIIAILAGAMVPLFRNTQEDAKVAKILDLTDTLRDAVKRFYFDVRAYPIEYGYAIPGYEGATYHELATCHSSLCPSWKGPYINKALSLADNPYGGEVLIHKKLDSTRNCHPEGFDLNGDGTVDVNGDGSNICFANVTVSAAKKVDEVLDSGIPVTGNDWKTKGRVEYEDSTGGLGIYVMGGT
jgi:prepilin-type N-terminal cleavage/methylation domain-containing protein